MVEVSLTVGKLDASLALLLTKDHHLIEFPTILLPDGINAGSVVTIKCEKDSEQEEKDTLEFERVQNSILELYGTREPIAPVLKVKNITQTSIILEWDNLEIGSSTIKSLVLYKNNSKLGHIPKPLITKTTKLSGLAIDTEYEFFLKLETTAGIYKSNTLKLKTHKMTDLSGITVCIGDLEDGITIDQISNALHNISAKELQTEVKVDTTHFITTRSVGDQWQKAIDNNIPIVRPEWLKACELERRIVGVRDFYLDADPKFLEQHRFTKEAPVSSEPVAPVEPETEVETVPVSNEETEAKVVEDPVTEIQEDLEEIDINDGPVVEEIQETIPEPEPEPEQDEVPITEADVVEPVAEPIAEPVEPVAEPVEESVEEPVEEPIEEPVQESELQEEQIKEPEIQEPEPEVKIEEESEKPVEPVADDVEVVEPKEEEIVAEIKPEEQEPETEIKPEQETVTPVEEPTAEDSPEEAEVEDEVEEVAAETQPTNDTTNTNGDKKPKKKNKKKGKKK